MKKITVMLTFEVKPAVERRLIVAAKKGKDTMFDGEDDLRDAVHELVCRQIDADEDLFDALTEVCTDKCEVVSVRTRRK